MVGEGQLESFTLQPLDSSYVKGTFHTDSNADEESQSIKDRKNLSHNGFLEITIIINDIGSIIKKPIIYLSI